ncbi:M56 family metallopeptidase [Mucilaginibacter gotjawali]|uniref:BlaR1 peptidase M56 n=2 Tax=Mucilaginibacter gotjawali TaxID=1550579 RepID=A0A0X8X3X5_9SPHI|nr:M56 family metallopeptidase [Mucilaginibacter gotjawali]MBB3057589.1 beta-lactamase regulating signal transducer with metallopeptidase domain [Mucilaginibacter gotjawali]BAU55249.1 BlaR1 peptidase M56 [Mucilaginibacter gotjawali]
MNWLQYLLEANLYLGVFYLVYCLLLNRETYYLFNRAYLLFSCVISFVLPLVQLGFLRRDQSVQTVSYVIAAHGANNYDKAAQFAWADYFTLQNCVLGVYLLGAVIFTVLLIIKLTRLFRLTRSRSAMVDKQYKLVHINDSNSAFSFFNYLFIGTKAMDAEIIIRHELVHIRQKHSFDIILLELLRIINWFNPLIYLLQNSLKTVHEYIADEQTASYKTNPLAYSTFLVNNAYGIGGPSVTHSFFNYNLLKKRIIMLNQKRSGSLARLKYLLTVPVCAGLLCVSTLGFSKTYGWVVLAPKMSSAINSVQKVKTLKLTEGDIVGYGDKMTVHGKLYTVNNVTDADEAYLLKTYKIKLEVVEIKGKPGQATLFFPSTGTKDTDKNSSGVTSKGYKYRQAGYVVNNKSDILVIITEKNGEERGYYRNSLTPAQVHFLKEKYGYTYPKMAIFAKLPPPPPRPVAPVAKQAKLTLPTVKADVTIVEPVAPVKQKLALPGKPEKPAPPVKAEITINEPVAPVQVKLMPPPPPMAPYMPLTNAYAALEKYIAKHVRYPAVARENKVTGSAVIQFDLNADHKITNVALIKGIGNRCDEEAMRVLNEYNDAIDAKTGTYKVAVTFLIDGLPAPKPASETLSNDPSFIGEVVVETYL